MWSKLFPHALYKLPPILHLYPTISLLGTYYFEPNFIIAVQNCKIRNKHTLVIYKWNDHPTTRKLDLILFLPPSGRRETCSSACLPQQVTDLRLIDALPTGCPTISYIFFHTLFLLIFLIYFADIAPCRHTSSKVGCRPPTPIQTKSSVLLTDSMESEVSSIFLIFYSRPI